MRKTFSAGLLAGVGLFGAAMWLHAASPHVEETLTKKVIHRAVQSSVPGGYSRVGETDLYVRVNSSSIDFYGMMGNSYYGSTYSDGGYRVAMRVNSSEGSVDCLSGTTYDGVTCKPEVVQQGEFARVIYRVTNSNDYDAVVSLGSYADVMIGSNDRAPISRRVDTVGNTYGLSMRDGGGAQLCLLFGSGLVGVNPVSDFWFGYYGQNNQTYQILGSYSHGSNWMEENGSYDSGMGWCWKDRTVPAGATVEFSYLIGVGDVNLEPNSSFAVTPEDPEGWNDLSRPHELSLTGTYESPAGQNGRIDYAVEDGETWIPLTEDLSSGSAFEATLTAQFTPGLPEHTIRFRTVDAVGNVSNLPPIVYRDVAFVEWESAWSGVYDFGRPVETEVSSAEFTTDEFSVRYVGNINAGVGQVFVEGVFPTTIGRYEHPLTVEPYDLQQCEIEVVNEREEDRRYTVLDYETGEAKSHTPQVKAVYPESMTEDFVYDKDYMLGYRDNVKPGDATIVVRGIGNYTGTREVPFHIGRGYADPALTYLFGQFVPMSNDITYDMEEHCASVSSASKIGYELTYYKDGVPMGIGEYPCFPGSYEIYVRLTDLDLYEESEPLLLHEFTIYAVDEEVYKLLGSINAELMSRGWQWPWRVEDYAGTVNHPDLTVSKGKIVGLNLSGRYLEGGIPLSIFTLPDLETINLSDMEMVGDLTQTALAIKASGVETSSIKHLDISGNELTGNIGVFAALFPNLETLNASGNRISDIVPPLAETVTFADLSSQHIDKVISLNTSAPDVESLAVQIPSVLLYDKNTGQYRSSVNMLLTEVDAEEYTMYDPEVWALQVTYDAEGLSMPYVSPQNVFYGEKPALVTALLLNEDGTREGSSMKVSLTWDDGDSNFVGGLTIADLQATILYAFGVYRQYPFNFTAADTFKDKRINVQDVVCTVDMLMKLPVESYLARRSAYVNNTDADIHIWVENGKILIQSDKPVAALSLRHSGDIKWDLPGFGLTSSIREGALIAYSLTGGEIPAGRHILGEISEDTALIYGEGASPEGRDLSVCFGNPDTVSVDGIGADEGAWILYRLDGVKATDSSIGPKIRLGEGKTKKIIH